MLRLLADENFNGEIVRGLLLRRPGANVAGVQDVGLATVRPGSRPPAPIKAIMTSVVSQK